jgi:CHAT domain-containing protein/tetratricopeptide (TPR) repeat protein
MACPDASLIAAHADRRLAGDEAARMDEHIAGCADCYEIFTETVRFALAEPEAETEGVRRTAARFGAAGARLRRLTMQRMIGLAAAAVLVLAAGLWLYRVRAPRPAAPLVAQLAEAMGTHRFVEPRLTGGFRHGRLITLRAGETPQGLDAQPGNVLAAVARIRERAEGDTSPDALGALGVTYLVSGDAAAAVKVLESASAQKPDDPGLLSDLAAAYLVRAKQADEPADIPKALEAAERAIVLPDPPVEVYFNRALALESLHLVDAARKAWGDYLERDPSSAWADEARQHLEALAKARRSSVEEDKARVRAAIEAGPESIDRLTQDAPSLVREYFEAELLPAWADAHLVGHPDARLLRDRAQVVGEALSRSTRDAMPQEAAHALLVPTPTVGPRDPLRAQASGYRALRQARRRNDRLEPSCQSSREAAGELKAGDSPYSAWAGQMVADSCLRASSPASAMTELAQLGAIADSRGYVRLLGRVHWLQGLIHLQRGELTASLDQYRAARAAFVTSRDDESEAFILVALAENLHLLGEKRRAWNERVGSLSRLSNVRSSRRRHAILSEALVASMNERMPRAALHFGTAVVETAVTWSRPMAVSDALVLRAGIQHSLGSDDLAASDLVAARRWIDQIPDETLAARERAEADAAEANILLTSRPDAAARAARFALTYFQGAAPMRVPALHLTLARAQAAGGLDDGGETELRAGIEALERERTSVQDAALQLAFVDEALPLFDEMVRLQIARRHDPERALEFVERGRARQLVDSLAGATAPPLAPAALRRELPVGLALIYYVSLDERLFAWTLTRDRSDFIERSLPAAELSRLVAANRAAIEERAPQQVVRRTAARLHDELVRPLIPFISSQRALIFVPEGVLQTVAFAGLWNRQTRRYLIEDHLLGVAPSGTVSVRASRGGSLPYGEHVRALVVGNPHFDRQVWSAPDLPGAEAEATEVAGLYDRSELLMGTRATKAAFLGAISASTVVHYAGHASASTDAPSATRLLLAADPQTGDSGATYVYELAQHGLPRTRVVVLAACRTAAGSISRVEGTMSLGRPFLAAGVPTVVASLWDVDDAISRRFFVSFHRALLLERDPVRALRTAQIALLRSGDESLSHPANWAAFISIGGLGPHSLSKGEMS